MILLSTTSRRHVTRYDIVTKNCVCSKKRNDLIKPTELNKTFNRRNLESRVRMEIEMIPNHREKCAKGIRQIADLYEVSISDGEVESFMQFYDYNGIAETINNVVAWCKKRSFNCNEPTGLALRTY